MKLIVFVGPKGSGKDASAKILKDEKVSAGNVSFASPLKRICGKVFDIHHMLFSDPAFKDRLMKEPITVTNKHIRAIRDDLLTYVDPNKHFYNLNAIPASKFIDSQFKTPREILQVIGTELIRNHLSDTWHCAAAFSDYNLKLLQTNLKAIHCVTDCRFISEYDYLKENHDCTFFYVERPEAEENLAKATHQSEREVIQVRERIIADGGKIIENYGSLEDLEVLLDELSIKKPETKKKASK